MREISDATNISVRYLEALEENRFDILPGPVFVRGFLRQYARHVGLDPDEVVNSYLTAHGAAADDEEIATPLRRRGREWVSGVVLAVGVLLLLAAVAALAFYVERSGARQTRSALAAPPVTEAPSLRAPEPAAGDPVAPLVVTLDFQADCWVEATVDEGRPLSQLHLQGESLRLAAERRVLLTLGEPTAVRIEVNGQPYAISGVDEGRPARDVLIELPRSVATAPAE